jgi:hypothetical protein
LNFILSPEHLSTLTGFSGTLGCQIFMDTINQNGGKYTKLPLNYQTVIKYVPIPNIPNGHRICQPVSLQGPPKFTAIGIFGLKIYHLATLVERQIEIICIEVFKAYFQLEKTAPSLIFQMVQRQEPILHTIASYGARAIKHSNATNSVLKTKKIIFNFQKRSSLEPILRLLNLQLQRQRCT